MTDDKVVTIKGKPLDQDEDAKRLLTVKGFRKFCRHAWVIDEKSRSIACSKCHREGTAWDVLLELSGHERIYEQRIAALRDEINELKAWSPRLRATRALERIWRGSMVPRCPSCGVGIDALDMIKPGLMSKDVAQIHKAKKTREPDA